MMSLAIHPADLQHAASSLGRYFVWVMLLCSTGFYAAASLSALRFAGRRKTCRASQFLPRVSVLKPVHGVDFGSEENFKSFCTQNYPNYEILFAVSDGSDAALPLIKLLIDACPGCEIRIVTGAPFFGENRKVNNLIKMIREAKHEILVITDGDVRVGPDYLRSVVAPFEKSETGAVTSLYRGITQPGLFAEMEALGAATDFAAGVLVAERTEGLNFALGASIVTTKSWIKRIGGMEPIARLLADDYELGHRIAQAGGEVILSNEVVSTMYPAQSWRGFWDHQLRWARTVRLCRPLSYLGLIFTHGLPWAILATLFANTWVAAAAGLFLYLTFRLAAAFLVGGLVLQDETVRRRWWLIPVRDALHFIVWFASFTSNRVTWGDAEFTMKKGEMISLRNSQ